MDSKTRNEFITKVFNYYNGKINVHNKAKLFITNVYDPNDRRAAYSRYPNIVVVQSSIININSQMIDFEILVLESIIHELYHTDQFIIYSRINKDRDYLIKIESTVEFMTASYILSNKEDILFNLGIDITPYTNYFINNMRRYQSPILYERATVVDHICLAIDAFEFNPDMTREFILKIIEFAEKPNSVISINNGTQSIILKDKNYYIDIDTFNDAIYNLYFKYDYFGKITITMEELQSETVDSLILTIKICSMYNKMVRVIR